MAGKKADGPRWFQMPRVWETLLYKNPGRECGWPRAAFLLLENRVGVTATYCDSGMFSSEHRRREEDWSLDLLSTQGLFPWLMGQASCSEGPPFSPHPPKPPGTPHPAGASSTWGYIKTGEPHQDLPQGL